MLSCVEHENSFITLEPNTFVFLFSNKMMVINARIYKMLVRITNREDPDHIDSSEAVRAGSALFV